MNSMRWVGVFAVAVLQLAACSVPAGEEETASAEQALVIDVSSRSVSYDYAALDQLPAGVAGGKDVVFVGSPLEGRVLALGRLSGTGVGELPSPSQGFILPFILKSLGTSRVAVLDAGGLPSPAPFVPANPTIHEYEYRYSVRSGFTAELVRTISFESALIGFAEDIVSLGDGRWVLSDAVLGGLWVAEADGTVRPGITPESLEAVDAIPQLAMCPDMPLIEVGGLPFLFSGSTLPGVSPLAVRGETLYFYSPCAEGVYSVPIATLFDDREPHERAADIRLVSAKSPSVPVEQLLGLTFNPYVKDDPYLYAADSLQLRIVRIDVKTGARQVVADSPTLFNFPSSTAFLPPIGGISPLLVVSNQQHRTPLTNDAIGEDLFEPPFLVTKVYPF